MALQKRTGFSLQWFRLLQILNHGWIGSCFQVDESGFSKTIGERFGKFQLRPKQGNMHQVWGPRDVNFLGFPGGGEDSPFKDLPVPRKHICYHGRGGGKCPHCCHSSLLPMMTRIKLDSKYEPIWPLGQCILQTCIRNYWIWHIIWKRIFIFYENVFKRKYV